MTPTTSQDSRRDPIRLSRVLEEEYETLHGPLPRSYAERKEELMKSKTGVALHDALIGELGRLLAREKSAALCLSGGGIRSATFGLGVIQGLAAHGLLDQFHYLSTVSGGGYLGSWLSSWIARVGRDAVIDDLKAAPTSRLNPEPRPIRHLRNYSNYLTPKLGLFTADTWTLIATYLRNLLINWLVWLPLLLAVLAVPRMIIEIARWDPHELPPAVADAVVTGGFTGGIVLALLGIVYTCLNMPSVRESMVEHHGFFWDRHDRERWLNDKPRSFFTWCYVPLLGAALLLAVSWAWLRHEGSAAMDEAFLAGREQEVPGALVFMLLGVGVHLLGWLAATAVTAWRAGGIRKADEAWKALRAFRGNYSSHETLAIVLSGLVAGAGLWIVAEKLFPVPGYEDRFGLYACFAVPSLLFVFLLAGAVYVGLASHWTTDQDREWWSRSSAWIMIGGVVWGGLCTTVIFGPVWLFDSSSYAAPISAAGGVTGLLAVLLGFSAKTRSGGEEEAPRGWPDRIRALVPIVAAPLALAVLAAFLSLVTSWFMQGIPRLVETHPHDGPDATVSVFLRPEHHLTVLHHTNGLGLAVALLWLLALGAAMGWLVNINRFSLHAMYRDRLIRAYLGASNERRSPNPFTGFDSKDNIEMAGLAPGHGDPPGHARLFHVVNIALNLVKKDKEKLAWQERKAESFTVSPLHAGNWRLGYRPAKEYGRHKAGRAISLGTAVAISGAAATPNMGYHSSPAVTFLMTLFNLRLGWWLGNPGPAGSRTYDQASPDFAIGPIIQEALGFTNDANPYVYLSDGGHFENLGLYEMVLRRVRVILVVDASRDEACAFEDLGNAIRKIRVDLGIPVTMGAMQILSREARRLSTRDTPKACALGTVEYSRIDGTDPMDDGVVMYIKPTLCGDEPVDVYHYAQVHPTFPHESTHDQWFSESQFESYRALGLHVITRLCAEQIEPLGQGWSEPPLAVLRRRVERYLARHAEPGPLRGDLAAALREVANASPEPRAVV